MIKTVRDAWQIPELRRKILFTIFALLIFRLGAAIPVPYINTSGLETYLSAQSGTILGLMNAMSGSAFSMATLFALSIQPYINSSIIIQLLTVAIPALERLAKEGGEEGRKKIASITRYTTVAIGLIQGFGYYSLINSYGLVETEGLPAVWVAIVIILSFTAGSAFLMWLGEQITEFGIGNGISVLLFAGIVSRFPHMLGDMISGIQAYLNPRTEEQLAAMTEVERAAYENSILAPWMIAVIVVGMLALVVLIVFISNSERRLPVQYAKRVVGRKMYGGQSTHIPIKVNMGGVMPIIFAQSIAMIPATIGAFAGWTTESGGFGGTLMMLFDTANPFYSILYFLLIVGFSYFYASMQFNPVEVANNLKKNGGFIPGFRPGKPTADFITKVLNKITMFGALYLSVVAIAPIITGNLFGYSSLAIGGTSVIIVVGVALETVKQMEAQMLMPGSKEVQRPAAVVERTIDSAYTAVPGRGESLRLVNAVRSLHQLAVRRLFFSCGIGKTRRKETIKNRCKPSKKRLTAVIFGTPGWIRTSGLSLRSTAYHFVNCSYHIFPCCFFANCAA